MILCMFNTKPVMPLPHPFQSHISINKYSSSGISCINSEITCNDQLLRFNDLKDLVACESISLKYPGKTSTALYST